jgi:hypothetical protein
MSAPDRQKIIDARSNDTALFYKIIKQQRGKLSRFIDQLQVDNSTYETNLCFQIS